MRNISLFFGAALMAACGSTPPKPSAPAPVVASVDQNTVLQFDHTGTAVYIGHSWKLANKKFSKLGAAEPVAPIVSPKGKLAFVGAKTVHIRLGARKDLPTMVGGATATFGYWIDEGSLYLHQTANGKSGCRVFTVKSGNFKRPKKGCVKGQFDQVTWLTGGGDNNVAVHTTNGTKNGIQIIKWTADHGQSQGDKGAKHAVNGRIAAFFTTDGYAIVTSCELAGDHKCDDSKSELYTAKGKTISPKHITVANGAAVSHNGKYLAWVANNKVCAGKIGTKGSCHSTP